MAARRDGCALDNFAAAVLAVRTASARDAAARARYEQQQRDYEAAMARNRAAQERYRRECERVRAQGGSCVISR